MECSIRGIALTQTAHIGTSAQHHLLINFHNTYITLATIPLQQHISLISPTLLHEFTLKDELATHCNRNFVQELIHNIQHGCSKMLVSAYRLSLILDNAILQECNARHILRPLDSPPFPDCHCSDFGLSVKARWWVAHNLSLISSLW